LVQLIWNAENRLSEVRDSSGTTLASYSYDHLGRRIAKTSGGVTTYYVYDGWNPIAEYTGTTLSKAYTWGMDLIGSMQAAGGVGGLLAVTDGIASYYPTYDGNGNISEYLDSGGTTQAHYEYDAFGNETVKTGAKANDFAHRFSTKPQDTETGLYYYGYRYYDPVTGRWPSRDPIEEKGGINLYAFVENNGINLIDYLGYSQFSAGAIEGSGGVAVTGCIIPSPGTKLCFSGSFKVEGGSCCKDDGTVASVVKITGSLGADFGFSVGIPERLEVTPLGDIKITFEEDTPCPEEIDNISINFGLNAKAGPQSLSCSINLLDLGEGVSCRFGFEFGLDVSLTVGITGSYSVISVK
jgi:RHS repeat-associated protein